MRYLGPGPLCFVSLLKIRAQDSLTEIAPEDSPLGTEQPSSRHRNHRRAKSLHEISVGESPDPEKMSMTYTESLLDRELFGSQTSLHN
jgi:hypothetical protein